MMIDRLAAQGRAAEIAIEHDIYGWLEGSWNLDVSRYGVDVRGLGVRGEAHFGWVLEGRAMQDVWIMKHADIANTYGTTLRVWEATLGAWKITWMNPISGRRDELIGRKHGNDIVQIGTHGDGTPIRWSFVEITNDSFRWLGEALEAGGWKLEAEFHGRRKS